MPHLPGRAARLHHGQDVISRLCDPAVRRRSWCVSAGGASAVCTIAATALGSAQHGCGLAEPGGALLGQGSGFVLGVAGLQGRLLGQVQRFDRGRWSAMVVLELDGELAAAGVDVGAAGGPALVQSRVDADDLPDRPLRRVGAGPFGERTPKLSRRCCSRAVL